MKKLLIAALALAGCGGDRHDLTSHVWKVQGKWKASKGTTYQVYEEYPNGMVDTFTITLPGDIFQIGDQLTVTIKKEVQ